MLHSTSNCIVTSAWLTLTTFFLSASILHGMVSLLPGSLPKGPTGNNHRIGQKGLPLDECVLCASGAWECALIDNCHFARRSEMGSSDPNPLGSGLPMRPMPRVQPISGPAAPLPNAARSSSAEPPAPRGVGTWDTAPPPRPAPARAKLPVPHPKMAKQKVSLRRQKTPASSFSDVQTFPTGRFHPAPKHFHRPRATALKQFRSPAYFRALRASASAQILSRQSVPAPISRSSPR